MPPFFFPVLEFAKLCSIEVGEEKSPKPTMYDTGFTIKVQQRVILR